MGDLLYICEEDPQEILELLHLRQGLSTDLVRTSHLFPVEDHDLELGGADSHPRHLTPNCKPPQQALKVLAR